MLLFYLKHDPNSSPEACQSLSLFSTSWQVSENNQKRGDYLDKVIIEILKKVLEEHGPDVAKATTIAIVKELVKKAFENLSARKKKKRR